MEKFHYWSTWNISNILTVEVREVSLQGAGGSLWSSVPSQNLLWSMPSGCLALDKWFCSGSIQKDTIRSGIRTHIYVVPRGQQRDFLTVCSHADWCESRKTQWECSLEAFVQGVGEQTKLVLVFCAHELASFEQFVGESLNMKKRQDIVQNMPLTGSPPPLKTFHLKKEKYQLEL